MTNQKSLIKSFGLHVLSEESELLNANKESRWDICPKAEGGREGAMKPNSFEKYCSKDYTACQLYKLNVQYI